jgi:hypothetical protein
MLGYIQGEVVMLKSIRWNPGTALLLALLIALPGVTSYAGGGDDVWSDSLLSLAAEPSLQAILDSLGYDINVQTDELGWTEFCAPTGTNVATLLAKMSSSYASAYSGIHNSSDSTQKSQFFGPTSEANDSVEFVITNAMSVGVYFKPGISGGYTWYTNPAFNRDHYDHAKLFPTKQSRSEYIIAFEDLRGGGDNDFNDMIMKVRFAQEPPVVQLPSDMYINACVAENVCFDLEAYDRNCLGDTLTVSMVQGFGSFAPVAGVGAVSATHCFMPYSSDVRYTFVFKVTDNAGLVDYDTLIVDYDINSPPSLIVPSNFDTTVCSQEQVCFTISGTDPDGDILEYEMVEGYGSIDPVTGEICFTPTLGDSAVYKFRVIAKDPCCYTKEGICSLDPLCPYRCPEDTVAITVKVHEAPTLVSVPDVDTALCAPSTICFPIVVSSPDDRPYDVAVTPPATYDPQTSLVCMPASQDGIHQIVVTVSDEECGVTDVDTATVTVDVNSAPTVYLPNDTTLALCQSQEFCFSATGSDPDGEPVHYVLETGTGQIDPNTGIVCFTPTSEGNYTFIVSVKDECEAFDADTIVIAVDLNSPPMVHVPDTSLFVCALEQICLNVTGSDPDPGEVLEYSLMAGPGTIDPTSGVVCFAPVGAGTYRFIVRVTDHCELSDVDTGDVIIGLNRGPNITAPPASNVLWCLPSDSICFDLTVTDPDIGQQLVVEQLSGASGLLAGNRFCFKPSTEGLYQFMFRVVDPCGVADTAQTSVTVDANGVPVVTLPSDFAQDLCSPQQICVPVTIQDDGPTSIEVFPIGSFVNGQVCFTASKDTTYCVTVRATDDCGAQGQDQICITVSVNANPTITLGPDKNLSACDPGDSVCFSYTATDPDGTTPTVSIVVGHGTVKPGEVCFAADTAGRYYFVVRAADQCGQYRDDDIFVTVTMNRPPALIAANDTTVLLCALEQVCFTNAFSDPDPGDQLTFELVSGSGVILPSVGKICFTPTGAGNYRFIIKVTDLCGASDRDTVDITVDLNNSPDIVAADQEIEFVYCGPEDTPDPQCFIGLAVSDPDITDVLTVTQICGPGSFDPSTLTTCFVPVLKDTTYDFCYRVTDKCGSYDEVTTHITSRAVNVCDTATCITVTIEDTEDCVYNGSTISLNVFADMPVGTGGFDILIKYDVTGFTFLSATPGPALSGWEMFNYVYMTGTDCGGPCPEGLIRIVAMTDINNGAHHPPSGAFYPSGSIIKLNFSVTDNVQFGGYHFPVNFYWIDCGDNGVSSIGGDTLFVDKLILRPDDRLVWNEFDDALYPEASRPAHVGAPDSCAEGGKTAPLRCIAFQNGGICIISPDSIDLRGDINLNDVPYDVADAVLFTNYFIWGSGVFKINREGQIAATDVNADGKTLTVGDLVYLIRVLTDDAQPIPKLSPYADEMAIDVSRSGGAVGISTECRSTIGAANLVFSFDPSEVTPGVPELDRDASNMEMIYSVVDGTMRVLIHAISKEKIDAGSNAILTIPVDGDGEMTLVNSEASDYIGNQLRVYQRNTVVIPESFTLSQNHPNPFNPETEFELSLPNTSEWSVQILNIQGQVVKSYAGSSSAGVVRLRWDATDDSGSRVASGIYFYRAIAGSHSETRKMVLLK